MPRRPDGEPGRGEEGGLTESEIFDRAIPRLRALVPRELYNEKEEPYLSQKLAVCLQADILEPVPGDDGRYRLGPTAPRIRYPDGTVRDYEQGLEAAKARIDADNAKLKRQGFKIAKAIPSIADKQRSEAFQTLVASMREHGWMRQFPMTEAEDGEIVDGRARAAAAAIAGVSRLTPFLFGQAERRTKQERRDTPLHRFLMARDANRARLSEEALAAAHQSVEHLVKRPWADIDRDLAISREWRLKTRGEFAQHFDVTKHAYRPTDEPTVQISDDGKVGVRSLIEAAGLPHYQYTDLVAYTPKEYAITPFSGGKRALFVAIDAAVDGIAQMQADRESRGLRLDRRWDDMRSWLLQRGAAAV